MAHSLVRRSNYHVCRRFYRGVPQTQSTGHYDRRVLYRGKNYYIAFGGRRRGSCIESGYVVYSPEAKQRLLKVRAHTINTFNLTSCEVAREMVLGALDDSPANVAVATTGILGPDVIDGIPPGTVCFAWAYRIGRGLSVFSRKERFMGSRQEVQLAASLHALKSLPHFHQLAMAGEGA